MAEIDKYKIEFSEGMKALYKMVDMQPTPLVSIDNKGEVTSQWNVIKAKAAQYVPGAYSDANTAWAYALNKLKEKQDGPQTT